MRSLISFALFMLVIGFAFCMQPASRQAQLINGSWQDSFEESFNEAIPLYQKNRNFWGWAEYQLFGEGRKGVLIGQQGWLFTTEEFSCPRNYASTEQTNSAYMQEVRRLADEKQVQLQILLIPAKARVYAQHLPNVAVSSCRTNLYDKALAASGSALNLHQLYQVPHGLMFMHTDTHWTPAAARLTAQALAMLPGLPTLVQQPYETKTGLVQPYNGDLTRFIEGVDFPPDDLAIPVTNTTATPGLLDEAEPQVVLVGTSYSNLERFNFAGALRQALQADVLNKSVDAVGPFVAMQRYLESEAWRTNPPKLLIWEIPERYVVLPR